MPRIVPVAVLLAVPLQASAATLDVCPAGCPYTSIGAALAVSLAGDTIQVHAGTYSEGQLYIGDAISIVGIDGPAVTTIQGTALGELFKVDADLTLQGVTVVPGGARGLTVRQSATATLFDVVLEGAATSADGAGLWATDTSTVVIDASTFRNNGKIGSTGSGGHLAADLDATITVTGSTFEGGNAALGGAIHGGVRSWLYVYDSTFVANHADAAGGAIWADGERLEIAGSTFDGNDAAEAGGAVFASFVTAEISASTFLSNAAGTFGGAVRVVGGLPVLLDNHLEGNTAFRGGALDLQLQQGGGTVARNHLCNNVATDRGGAVFRESGTQLQTWTWTNNLVHDNEGATGGGLWLDGKQASDDVVENNTFVGNAATSAVGGAVYAFDLDLTFVNNAVTDHAATALSRVGAGTTTVDYSLWHGNTADTNVATGAHDLVGVAPEFSSRTDDGVCSNDRLWPTFTSPLVDAGDPTLFDPDGSVSDIGAYGGPDALSGFYDADGDGWSDSDDCDDADPSIHPGAVEVCDGIDQDCDGTVDDGATGLVDWYEDADGDGYGDGASVLTACTPPTGWVTSSSDCDDTASDVYPGAYDLCGDGIDADCDGVGGPTGDEDGDGISWADEDALGADDCATDSDGDGVSDVVEFGRDTDGDGTPDIVDLDDDGDGIDTVVEIGWGFDPQDADSDGDGVGDLEELGTGATPLDTDLDGLYDALDPDDDNDGIPTLVEGSGDADGDGTPNHRDFDSDGDGTLDLDEGTGDTDNDGIPNYLDANDTVPDYDPDADGLMTVDENAIGTDPLLADTDGDGRDDLTEVGDPASPIDTDGDGLIDALDPDDDDDGIPTIEEENADTDGDLLPNYLDDDDDGDGIPTIEEDTDGDGDWTNDDADGDGVPDYLDPDGGSTEPTGDGDSDNDGISDADELAIGSNPYGVDSDGDTVPDGAEVGDPSNPTDTDGDDTPDILDPDDDGDGIPTATEGTADIDADGIPNHLDPDSDGDGASDAAEGTGDRDGNGVPDYLESGASGGGTGPTAEPTYGFGLGCSTTGGAGGPGAWLPLLLLITGGVRRRARSRRDHR